MTEPKNEDEIFKGKKICLAEYDEVFELVKDLAENGWPIKISFYPFGPWEIEILERLW